MCTQEVPRPPLITVDPFARGVDPTNLNAILDNAAMYWAGNQPPLPYRWNERGCDDMAGYGFTLTYTDKDGEQHQRRKTLGKTTNRRTDLDEIVHEVYSREDLGPDDWFEYWGVYYLEVVGYLTCAEPRIVFFPMKSVLSMSEQTQLFLFLACDEQVMDSANVELSLKGPRPLDASKLVTNHNGAAQATYRARGDGLAAITATWLPMEHTKCSPVSQSADILIGPPEETVAIVTKRIVSRSRTDNSDQGAGVTSWSESSRELEATVRTTYEYRDTLDYPGAEEIMVSYGLKDWELVESRCFIEVKSFYESISEIHPNGIRERTHRTYQGGRTPVMLSVLSLTHTSPSILTRSRERQSSLTSTSCRYGSMRRGKPGAYALRRRGPEPPGRQVFRLAPVPEMMNQRAAST